MQPVLGRGHVQKVTVAHLAGREVLLLDLRVPGETIHVILVAGLGVGILDATRRARLRDAMRGAPSPAQVRWRTRTVGSVVSVTGRRVLEFVRDGAVFRARSERGPELDVSEDEPFLAAAAAPAVPAPETPDDAEPSEAALQERGASIVDELLRARARAESDALRRSIAKAIARTGRRITAIEGDVGQAEGADALARRAQLFVAAAASATRGATRLVAVDWSSGAPEEVAIDLSPAQGAREQIDAWFRRARRLKDGARIARERLDGARLTLAALTGIAAALANPDADVGSLASLARRAAPRDFKLASASAGAGPRTAQRAPEARPPYRAFSTVAGTPILVGRGAAHNDALTLHVARPHDLWLHAKGHAGAHVVVRLDKGSSCPAEALVDAAHLAAHFSDARDERVVDVTYTPRRYIRKPRGSAPGAVVIDREKVIVLRRDDAALRRLLATEAAQ